MGKDHRWIKMINLCIFSSSSSLELTKKICSYLGKEMGRANITHFPDGETMIKVNDDIRGKDCFIVASTSPPVNINIMELLIFIDCLKRASAATITAVIPYFGYARQDRKTEGRTPITAKMVADILTIAGISRLVTIDLHAKQIEGFFNVPVDNLSSLPVFIDYISQKSYDKESTVVLAPDVGAMKRANQYANALNLDIAVIDKRRINGEEAVARDIVGNVRDKHIFMFDDMISTAGTIKAAAQIAKKKGCLTIRSFATHGLFSGPAIDRLSEGFINNVVITDTIVLNRKVKEMNVEYGRSSNWPFVSVVSVAQLLGEAILRIYEKRSVSILLESKQL